ncbi:phage holin [Bacillus licheniformis]|uniref:phage holin n=1 Tax=Bacillus licheniformis TaxID=1402 RepID=UPI0011BDE8CC|nr:phage holin [Bacillus licheniformis]MCA1183622.1 phage holin [Bacillus licheniformis]MCY7743762.1 phage holin [Bacillus licheniformis]MCY7954804.1 phage holin [Bacillus licheniformis]MCY9220638.1 phage holin [Bacillus licheniformis]MEC1349188.1 phage holin [Bacillus licheniformis]
MNVKTIENISAGTVARFVLLALALVNQTLTMTGNSPIPVDEEGVQQFISLAFMGVTSLWAYWKNNDVTKKARTKGE